MTDRRRPGRRWAGGKPLTMIWAGLGLFGLAVVTPLALLRWAEPSQAEISDSDVIGINRLEAATLDIEIGEVEALVGLATESGDRTAANLAPGDVVVGAVEVANVGSLSLVYGFTVDIANEPLSAWLSPASWIPSGSCADEAIDRVRSVESGSGTPVGSRLLEPGRSERVCLAALLPLSTPNTVQGEELVVRLLATAEHAIEPEP